MALEPYFANMADNQEQTKNIIAILNLVAGDNNSVCVEKIKVKSKTMW